MSEHSNIETRQIINNDILNGWCHLSIADIYDHSVTRGHHFHSLLFIIMQILAGLQCSHLKNIEFMKIFPLPKLWFGTSCKYSYNFISSRYYSNIEAC